MVSVSGQGIDVLRVASRTATGQRRPGASQDQAQRGRQAHQHSSRPVHHPM